MGRPSEYKLLPIDSLELDKTNPRIRKWLEQYGDSPSFEQMLLALGAGTSDPESGSTVTFQSLKESIRAHGRISTPIIVLALPDDRYRVVEGNTRVAIYRSFKEDGIKGDWDAIPAIVHSELTPREIDSIRLQCHIVGPRPWDPYSKAKYLDALLNTENRPLSDIVDQCGGGQKEILEYVEAYREMEKYYRPILESDGDFDPTRFSSFKELQAPPVRQAILETNFSFADFAVWVRDRRIDPQNTVRALPRILRNPQARAKFLAVNAREALKLLDVPPSPALASITLEHLLQTLIERLNVIPYADVKQLKADPGCQKAQLLFEANETLAEICKDLSSV